MRMEQAYIRSGVQLELPMPLGLAHPLIYVEIDATGIPVVQKETLGRVGKVDGQPAHTREVKLGCVFTSIGTDAQNRPVRDPASWSRARIRVVLGDGAVWIWKLAAEQFPGAILIVDFYHASEHLHRLSRLLFPHQEAARTGWADEVLDLLNHGKIDLLVTMLRSLASRDTELAGKLETEPDYFARNADKMRYPEFRAQGLFVGSGVIETGCKTVIGYRLKQSGMFWTVAAANSIIARRCSRLNGTFENFWEAHSAA
jgi:hypothetical protein